MVSLSVILSDTGP